VDKNDQWLGVVVKSEGPGGYVMVRATKIGCNCGGRGDGVSK
jgi:hypothetical protein